MDQGQQFLFTVPGSPFFSYRIGVMATTIRRRSQEYALPNKTNLPKLRQTGPGK